ncbi:glycosyltransferase family 8 protein [Herbaspirillum rhizosphaerae]|uniref:glycosyltransferase family 8 protein n=1 Tax=Herbaspirillum rhizosphaerae TaxID=346179 RepID=UPI00067AC50B|nr:glycosyltransferase [Herbaspirillum rhizosphaerae]
MTQDNSVEHTGATSGDEALHIAFGVDSSYFRGMGVAIASAIKNNPGMRFVFHVFAFSVSDDSRRRIVQLEAHYATEIRIHVLDPHVLDAFRGFPCFAQHHLGTFIRLLIPDLLQGVTKRVLYLDADLLCLGPMDELLSMDLDGCIAAAVHDQLETTASTQIAALGLPVAEYFNAGVMYINVDNWVAHDTQVKALTVLSTQELVFADQDALNVALNGRIRFIDEKWNYRYHLVDFLSRGHKTLDVVRPVVFMHFTGPVKPWHDWCLHEAKTIFIGYQNLSAWADMPLDQPKSARELKLFSKFLVKQGRTLEGIGWHVKYLWRRSAVSQKMPGKK